MADIQFQLYKTFEIKDPVWDSYIQCFNEVFTTNIKRSEIEHYYSQSNLGYSFHCFMQDGDKVVGACTFVPFPYIFQNQKMNFGLAVGAFVHEDYRKNPMALRKMYDILKAKMKEDNIAFVFAVPNDNSYQYWVKFAKWKNIGKLNYYILPHKIGNVLKKNSFFNIFSSIFSYIFVKLNRVISFFINPTQKEMSVEIDRSFEKLEHQRYTEGYFSIEKKSCNFTYKIYNENGVKTAYLIDFYNKKNKKDYHSLTLATDYILNHEKSDLIMFVGNLNFFQTTLIKVPKNKEPKHLPLIGEKLDTSLNENIIFDHNHWDFSLFNYDVR